MKGIKWGFVAVSIIFFLATISIANKKSPFKAPKIGSLEKPALATVQTAVGSLRVSSLSTTNLEIVNYAGNVVASLTSDSAQDGVFTISDKNGRPALWFYIDANGSGQMRIADNNNHTIIMMGENSSHLGSGIIKTLGPGKSAGYLFVNDGHGAFAAQRIDGEFALFVGGETTDTAVSGINLWSTDGSSIGFVSENGKEAQLEIRNTEKKVVVQSGSDNEGGGYVSIFDKDGNLVTAENSLLGDLDGDGDVDFDDFTLLAKNFGKTN